MNTESNKMEFFTLHQQAKILFIQDKLTLVELSARMGIPYSSVKRWAAAGNWKKLRQNFIRLHEDNLGCLMNELTELNAAIGRKPEGQRFPDLHEARLRSCLIRDILDLEIQPLSGEFPDAYSRFKE